MRARFIEYTDSTGTHHRLPVPERDNGVWEHDVSILLTLVSEAGQARQLTRVGHGEQVDPWQA
jgi:hypothetical protein